MEQHSLHSSQHYSACTPSRVIAPLKKVEVVYYLSYRDGLLEQPHLMEISLCSSRGLCLRDVKTRFLSLRGAKSSSFSWSYKRSYKKGFVWQDLESDDDLIFPTHNGADYVVKGCRIESSCTVEQIPHASQNMPQNWRGNARVLSSRMQPACTLAEFPAPSTLTQLTNVVNLGARDNYANPSRRGDADISFNLGVMEGLDHLLLAKASNPNYDNAESQASTPLDYGSHINAREQHNQNIENQRRGKEPTNSELCLKGANREKETYDSAQLSIITKGKTSSNIISPHVEADVIMQTGEDDEIINNVEYGEGCPDKVTGLGQDEISLLPCSTSSTSITTSTQSAAASNVVSYSIAQLKKLGSVKSSYLIADQNPQETEILLPSRVCLDKEAHEKEAMAAKSPVDCNGRETPNLSAKINKNLSSGVVDDPYSHKSSQAALNLSQKKRHVTNLCSNSDRFKLVIADLKLATQQEMFPAHFKEQEEGSRHVDNVASLEVTGDEIKEISVEPRKRKSE
ncbi:hypothetical protein L7F22_053200 [Adiantum nelumboides]|nr:hypothetical protein [Adiantum nelumboides]